MGGRPPNTNTNTVGAHGTRAVTSPLKERPARKKGPWLKSANGADLTKRVIIYLYCLGFTCISGRI